MFHNENSDETGPCRGSVSEVNRCLIHFFYFYLFFFILIFFSRFEPKTVLNMFLKLCGIVFQ